MQSYTIPTHPLYQSGPIAQAITAFYQQQEQARTDYHTQRQNIAKEAAANIESLLLVAEQRFGDLWPTIKPYITETDSTWEHEVLIDVIMPEVWPFQIRQQRTGFTEISYRHANLEPHKFKAEKLPIPVEQFAMCLLEGHQYWLKREAERLENEQLRAKKLAYAQAFLEYQREYVSTLTRNQVALALLQEEYRVPFTVWQLIYGITACHDEEGEFYADTRSVFVLKPDCDEDGFFPVLDETGKVTHRKYYSLVYLDGPKTFHVEPGSTYCGFIHVQEANASLYFSPLLPRLEVATRLGGWVGANMHPLPQLPQYGDFGLDEEPNSWDMEDLKRELANEEDEIPF